MKTPGQGNQEKVRKFYKNSEKLKFLALKKFNIRTSHTYAVYVIQ